MFEPKLYIRKRYEVDVVLVTEENIIQAAQWCGGEIKRSGRNHRYIIVLLEDNRTKRAWPGNYLVRSRQVKTFRVYSKKAFEYTFEEPKEIIEIDQLDNAVVKEEGE